MKRYILSNKNEDLIMSKYEPAPKAVLPDDEQLNNDVYYFIEYALDMDMYHRLTTKGAANKGYKMFIKEQEGKQGLRFSNEDRKMLKDLFLETAENEFSIDDEDDIDI